MILSVPKFATRCGVSKQAAYQALKEGRIFKGPGGVDTDNEVNRAYYEAAQDRTSGKVQTSKAPAHKPDKVVSDEIEVGNKPAGNVKPEIIQPPADVPTPGAVTKVSHEIERIKSVTAINNVKLAQQMKTLVLRELVDKVFGDISGVSLNYLHPIGARIAPEVCGICGITDSEKVLEVQAVIDKEVMRAIGEFKRIVEEEI